MNNPPLLPTGTPPLVTERSASSPLRSRSSWQNKLLITGCVLLGVSGLSAGSAALWYHHNFNASGFKPVHLSVAEQQAMDEKVAAIEGQKKAYEASKTVVLNEREINGYLESQGLGETVKVSINNGRVAATVLAPVDQEVPFLGGHTIRLKVAFNSELGPNHKLALSLADVSVGGISLPNAWLGGVKSMNLLAERGEGQMSNDFLEGIVAGIKDFQMKDGEIKVVLND